MNSIQLIGRLTYDPELKTTPSGVSVLRFQIAADRRVADKEGNRQADFIDCVAWRHTAEFISKYFHKGSMIAVEGSLQTQNYTDKDGNKRKSVDVVVSSAEFCGAKDGNGGGNGQKPATPKETAPAAPAEDDYDSLGEEIGDDDLPF